MIWPPIDADEQVTALSFEELEGTAAIEIQLERETGIEPATFSLGS